MTTEEALVQLVEFGRVEIYRDDALLCVTVTLPDGTKYGKATSAIGAEVPVHLAKLLRTGVDWMKRRTEETTPC